MMKVYLTSLLFLLGIPRQALQAQALLIINEDSTLTRTIRPRQFIECLTGSQATPEVVLRGRVKLFYTDSFLLETKPDQYVIVPLMNLLALRRINKRTAWEPASRSGLNSGYSTRPTGRSVSPLTVAGAAIIGAGIATLRGDLLPTHFRWSVYQGWQFRVETGKVQRPTARRE